MSSHIYPCTDAGCLTCGDERKRRHKNAEGLLGINVHSELHRKTKVNVRSLHCIPFEIPAGPKVVIYAVDNETGAVYIYEPDKHGWVAMPMGIVGTVPDPREALLNPRPQG